MSQFSAATQIAAYRQLRESLAAGRLSLDGDLWEPPQATLFHWRADDKWYLIKYHWDERVEIAPPAPARLRMWERNGDKNRPSWINYAGIPEALK